MNSIKAKLTAEQQVEHLSAKGVKFTIVSKEEATRYLALNTNFFKLTAYRKNFPKHPAGPRHGQYISLEFAHLQDLAVIDMRLRYVLLHMALDVEHYTKVCILKNFENASGEDGYSVISDYRATLDNGRAKLLNDEIARSRSSTYCRDIVAKYDGHFPLWAFIEIVPFGRLVDMCKFCAARLQDNALKDLYFLLLPVKQVRNAAAHNNCILNDLAPRDKPSHINYHIQTALGRVPGLSSQALTRKMRSPRIQQIATLLLTHAKVVTSEGVRRNRSMELHALKERMLKNRDYYTRNDMLASSFDFLQRVIDNWFPVT